ncbi:MAG TPA: phosphate ABC transporter substrate-binding/OmpA family protein [Burkholderiaceae bacterium]|jgi:outer membrane protein OmpA-like peptidoglycan-associated protein/ABC-type nitrate/sulfonate/bicarbonate transport system substrate-binding protein
MKLTALSKTLIAIVILGGAGSLLWNSGLKMWIQKKGEAVSTGTSGSSAAKPAAAADSHAAARAPHTKSAPLGSAANPLTVSIVSFHGYAPALVANGNSLLTQPGSIFERNGVHVEFVIQDDIPTLATIFEADTAQCAWRTSDFWAQEQPNLVNAHHDGRAVMIVDNTQGADAIIARDPNITRVEDLVGKKIALLKYTPSHGLLIDTIKNSSLNAKQKAGILDNLVYVNADDGTAGVRAAFDAGHVDAAVLWDPDLSLAIKAAPGSHVVYSTRYASNLIYDVMVCNSQYLNNPANEAAFKGFVAGWMEGVEAAKQNPTGAADALVRTEPFFDQLAKEQGVGFIASLFPNLVWTGLDDNARILGLVGGTNHYARVYREFDGIYREAGALANPTSPVIAPAQSVDTHFIEALLANNQAAKTAAARPQFTFDPAGLQKAGAKTAALTKPVTVNFLSGSADLSKRAKDVIDHQVVPFIDNNGSSYFEISGNTDSTGTHDVNMQLSKARAQAVVQYLTTQWEIPRNRFKVVGNGPDHPLCNEENPADSSMSLDDCRQMNRTTRIAVLGS